MKRGKFSLSYSKLLSCDMGELVPVGLTEVLPGDSIQHSTSALIRVSPLLAPVMHPVKIRIHHWFVPHRLVWNNWESFITGGEDGEDSSTFPVVNTGGGDFNVGTLGDYLGCPTDVTGTEVSALPFRGYDLIWNEWYRDQQLQTALTVNKGDGTDATSNLTLQNVCWEKDYFTSARPFAQLGPDVTLPLGDTAPVVPDGTNTEWTSGGVTRTLNYVNTITEAQWSSAPLINAVPQISNSGLEADLSAATAASINDLRLALAVQRYQEARSRYGARYTEYLRYLGVRSSDARLQRPEYLGGGKNTLQFSEVLQTGVTTDGDDTEGVGNLKGHGIGALRSNRYRRFFEEHGYIFTLMSVLPKTIYVQGQPRHMNRRTKEDFWQKELQHIGQQEVLNKEVYAQHAQPNGTFGYQDRYDEYRRSESSVSGEFRTTALDFWHMARIFGSTPSLNADFVKANPTKRINAVSSNDVLWVMVNHSIQARRLVSPQGTSLTF